MLDKERRVRKKSGAAASVASMVNEQGQPVADATEPGAPAAPGALEKKPKRRGRQRKVPLELVPVVDEPCNLVLPRPIPTLVTLNQNLSSTTLTRR